MVGIVAHGSPSPDKYVHTQFRRFWLWIEKSLIIFGQQILFPDMVINCQIYNVNQYSTYRKKAYVCNSLSFREVGQGRHLHEEEHCQKNTLLEFASHSVLERI